MVLIFGWGAGAGKDLGAVAPAVCPNCHNDVLMHHIRSEKKVSLYFIPVIPYGSNEYLACPTCRQGLQFRPEQRYKIENMKASTSQFRLGQLPAELYAKRVEQFWLALGIGPSGKQVVRPSAAGMPPGAPTHPGAAKPPTSAAPRPVAAAAPQAAAAAPVAPDSSLDDRLRAMAKLHADGILTDEEFAAAKRQILEL